ncbi:MAG: hypothetical protein ACJATT_000642 [Myxococcota bacterium]
MEVVFIIIAVFGGIAAVLSLPIAVVMGLPLAAWLGHGWLRIREREVATQELELVLRLRESQALPPWVDADDPSALLAWMQTDREMSALTRFGGKLPTV